MFTEQLAAAALADRSRERALATRARTLRPHRSRRTIVRTWWARLTARRERPASIVVPARTEGPRLAAIPVRSTPRRGS